VRQGILANPYMSVSKGRGIQIAEWLKQQGADIVLTPETVRSSGVMYALQVAGVRLEQVSSLHIRTALGTVVRNGG